MSSEGDAPPDAGDHACPTSPGFPAPHRFAGQAAREGVLPRLLAWRREHRVNLGSESTRRSTIVDALGKEKAHAVPLWHQDGESYWMSKRARRL